MAYIKERTAEFGMSYNYWIIESFNISYLNGKGIVDVIFSGYLSKETRENGSNKYTSINQQIPFVGINYANVFRNNIVVGSAELRVSPARNHYVSGIANYLRTGNDFVYLFNTNGTGYLGFAVKYAYQTTLGPLSINFHWSDYNKKVGCYVNFGYYF